MITKDDLSLANGFSDPETTLVLGALNLVPGPNDCAELMEVCADQLFANLPLNVQLHALAEKESTFRSSVVGIERDGTKAYGLFQFHQTTAQPLLDGIGLSWDAFLTSVEVQTKCVIALLKRDITREFRDRQLNRFCPAGSAYAAYREFGAQTRKIMYPTLDYLLNHR